MQVSIDLRPMPLTPTRLYDHNHQPYWILCFANIKPLVRVSSDNAVFFRKLKNVTIRHIVM